MRVFRVSSLFLACFWFALFSSLTGFAQSKDQLTSSLPSPKRQFMEFAPRGHSGSISPVLGGGGSGQVQFDSIRTFNGAFQVQGVGPQGHPRYHWYYTIAGRHPKEGGTTILEAPIIPVSLDLLDWDKSVRIVNGHKLHYSVKPYVQPVLDSPVFQNFDYTSSDVPTQFIDAVQRASFYNVMQQDWHTLLRPSVKTERTIAVPRGSYRFSLKKDGTCCAFVLVDINAFSNLLFPPTAADTHSPVGSAEHSGDITTRTIATFLFPNTYLYGNGDPNQCCVLGFHTYDYEPGDAHNGFRQKRYVLTFASWITQNMFGEEFQDVTALSHELAESLNDPFVASDGVHGLTPWWYSLNGYCQDDLEVADAIEGLTEATYPITMHGRTYHPQNEALLPWFEFQSPSTGIAGAYSYPNETLLTTLSPPMIANCQ
ncbi:MAG TPA: hypothetical protein VFM77_15650 [Terriglobales bacterium]|nr:hypothetical protein [Terriglobales bacterium]